MMPILDKRLYRERDPWRQKIQTVRDREEHKREGPNQNQAEAERKPAFQPPTPWRHSTPGFQAPPVEANPAGRSIENDGTLNNVKHFWRGARRRRPWWWNTDWNRAQKQQATSELAGQPRLRQKLPIRVHLMALLFGVICAGAFTLFNVLR